MAAHDPKARIEVARIAGLTRHRGAKDPAVARALHELRVVRAEEHLRGLLDDLTPADRKRLGRLLGDGQPGEVAG